MKKIAFVVPDLSLIGAQRVALDYAKELLDRGFSVSFISGNDGVLQSELSCNLYVFKSRLLRKIPFVRLFESLIYLGKHLRIKDYDVVISIAPFLNRILCLFKLLNIFRSKLIIEDHAYPPDSYKDEFGEGFLLLFYKLTEFIYKQSNGFRVLSQETFDYYNQSLGDTKVTFMPNFMDLERIVKLSEHKTPTGINFPYIFYIGRFTSQKNISFLIRAFASISRNIMHSLIIVGYGPERDALQDLINILGMQDRILIKENSILNFKLMREADIFPMTSLWEGMPLTMIEAMIIGTPIICKNFKAGPTYLLGNSERGKVVDTESEVEFGLQILKCLRNRKVMHLRSEAAKIFVNEKIDIKKNFNKYIESFLL